jgi:tetratricopeptide (TPR) repeat protein/predicted Ser/Thr protein kinase
MAQTANLSTGDDADADASTTAVTGSPRVAHEHVDTPWLTSDFEQRRVIDSVRGKLFGRRVDVRIGRYRVETRLGAGGMGEVYLATDEALDRRLAIKRVRGDLDRPSDHDRLRVEARALARLSHANVVQIYEVGEHEGQTFLAMEFIEGTTLTGWLDAQLRTWTEILAIFVAAGRGLAAAHSAGVVHRDFKPDNVLIGRDGRVCVADFGLAIAQVAREGGALVQSREIAGTIRYMSLEQLRGEPVDARADQFAYCTALCEALWEQAPFDRGNATRRALELEADRPTTPSRRGVPRELWPIVRRGLHRDPNQRWPDFDSLLAALEALPRRRARRIWAAVLAPLALVAGFALSRLDSPHDACAAVADELAGVWDAAAKRELVAAFVASDIPHGSASAERVVAGLDAWASEWTEQRSAQCRAADEPELARARRACLEQQREQVEVMTATLRTGDRTAIDQAIEAVAALPDPSACAVAELLEGPPPPGAAVVDEVEALRLSLAEQRSLRLLGRRDVEPAVRLHERADTVDHLPVRAEALAERGYAEVDGGDPRVGIEHLEEAARLAIAADHPRLLAQMWTDVALFELTVNPEPRRAADRLALAEAAWARITVDDRTQARLRFARARVELAAGRREQAIALYREAIDLHGERETTTLPGLLSGLADALEPSEPNEALALRERALAIAERVFGREHPETASHLHDLGSALDRLGDPERAAVHYERAIAIWMHVHGEPHPDLARAYLLLANQALAAGELDRAETHTRALIDIHDATLPIDHADRGDAAMLLGRIATLRGDRAEALEHFRVALRAWQREAGPGANHVIEMRLDIAGSELGLGEFGLAEADYRAILESTTDPALVGRARLGLAELALRRGELDDARAQLDAVDPAVLDGLAVSHVVLDFLIDARAGCRACADGVDESLARTMSEGGWTRELLAPWLSELGLSNSEWEALGFQPPE